MQQTIQPPAGYRKLEALNRQTHRFALAKAQSAAFCSELNALPLSVSEFTTACRYYPIVFTSPDGQGNFAGAAVVGLKQRQNLFVNEARQWDERAYVPAYVRCYPFCLATVMVDGKPRPDKLVCIAAEAVVSDGQELFTEEGQPTALWREREKVLQEYENDTARTAEMCRALRSCGLFKEFSLQVATQDKEYFYLKGMYRVEEAALAKLSAYQFRNLIEKGWLEKIYAHIISLGNFQSFLAGYQSSKSITNVTNNVT